MKSSLGRVKQVDLRNIWKHEANDFTNWLVLPENIELLSEEIDIDLTVLETEYNVGRFNVDIYAEEPNTKRKVIIENQLERTDHDHLGKLITYASGLDAEVIIWIVKEVLEEHQQAIEWLNENTDEKINFFAIKMEVWKIGESEPAPKFHIISKPNNWTKSIKQNIKKSSLSELNLLQLDLWNSFKEYATKEGLKLRLRKAHAQGWFDISFGRSDCHIALTVNSLTKEIGCEIYIPNSKETYFQFLNNQNEINTETEGLSWQELPTKKASRIRKKVKGDLKNREKWDDYFNWFGKTALKFQEIFNKY